MKAIPFHRPWQVGTEEARLRAVLRSGRFSGPGPEGAYCEQQLRELLQVPAALLTPSCTHALEMAALLCDLQPGDEVILPSYTFVSSANAFVLRGAVPVFVDVRPGDMNIDPNGIASAITERTRVIVVMHYAGMACDMDSILAIAREHDLIVVEDAAHCLGASYRGRALGTFGHVGTLSFHASKNIQCGEGGALIINKSEWEDRARRIREKGTNRPAFVRGEVDFYEWTEVGSSYLLGELSAAFLAAQLESLASVTDRRLALWQRYYSGLEPLAAEHRLALPQPLAGATHNGHIFFIRTMEEGQREQLATWLEERGVQAYFHYIPLHTSSGGQRYGRFVGSDQHTIRESNRLLRLPLYPQLSDTDVDYISEQVRAFFAVNGND